MPLIKNLELLRRKQVENCLSNEDMAGIMDMNRQNYNMARQGEFYISKEKVSRLTWIFDITYEELMETETHFPRYYLNVAKIRQMIVTRFGDVRRFCKQSGISMTCMYGCLNLNSVLQDKTLGRLAKALNVHFTEIIMV